MATADFSQDLDVWLEGFLLDRKAQNLAHGTILFYQIKLEMFLVFCKELGITRIERITPDALRRYLLWLDAHGHNPGGVHGCYRALKTFLLW